MRAEKQNSEIRKEQIVKAAMTLIADQGLKGLSVAAVARQVGIVPSALYRHFPGKEEILKATLEQVKELLMTNIQAVRETSPLALEQLRILSQRHIRLIREFQAIPRIVFSDELTASYPFRKSAVYAIIQAYLVQVEALIHQGQEQGQIKKDLNPKTVAVLFLGLVQPPIMLWHLSDGRFDAARHTNSAWAIFQSAITDENSRGVSPGEGAVADRNSRPGPKKGANHEGRH
jgi:AcrR family transcriptional regulator